MIEQLDTSLLLLLNGHHTPWLDGFMWLFTSRWTWIPLYVTIFAVMAKAWGWRRALALAVTIGACVALADQLCASILRPIFCRPRPTNPMSGISDLLILVNDYHGGRYGFPSCHAANSFALAVASSLIIRRWQYSVTIFLWATANCLTRTYLGVHYPGDLIVGAAIGSLIAWGVTTLVLRRIKPLSPPSGSEIYWPAAIFAATLMVISMV